MQRENFRGSADGVSESILETHRSTADELLDEEYGLLIGGEWVDGSAEPEAAVDAVTGEELATYQRGTADDVDRAVAAAQAAFEGAWGDFDGRQRAEKLEEIADRIEDRKPQLAKLDPLEMGKPNQLSLFADMTILLRQLRHFASLARTEDAGRSPNTSGDKLGYTQREPYGVVGQISAWNFPAMFVAWKTAPALAAGNTVVFKPSPRAVLSTLEIADIMDDVLPDGTVNVVPGDGPEVGAAISEHDDVRKVSITGSERAGRAVMQGAASNMKAVSLELGGKSPNIVCADADLEDATEGAMVASFFNAGQQCTEGARLFLHEDIADEFLETFTEKMERLELGDPLAPNTSLGPLVDHEHLETVQGYVDTAVAEGAEVLAGGEAPEVEGCGDAPFFEPTVLTNVDDDHTVACEEVFGPVITVHEWSDRDEVVRRANDTEYGLASAVWTTDLETAHTMAEDLEAGTVWVNCYNEMGEGMPHGGYKRSGIGRELDEEAFEDYRQTKSVLVNFGKPARLG
jgi:aldehyde dehydrogenase (NAD+)